MIVLHIQFEDESNPYVMFCRTEADALKELRKWRRHYYLCPMLSNRKDMWEYRAREKRPAIKWEETIL